MSFTFTNYAGIPPRKSPLSDIVGNLLSGYSGAVNAKYLPKEKESKIFANQIGPLATLATSPMFLQNPQFQQALSNLISKNSHMLGPGFEGMGGGQGGQGGGNYPNTYYGNVQNRVNETENAADKLSHAGALKTGLSSGAGRVEDIFGDFGKHILDWVNKATGSNINSNLAQQKNLVDTDMAALKKNALDTGYLSQKDADDVFTQQKDENKKQWVARAKRIAPALFQQGGYHPRSADEKIARDAQERTQYEQEHGGGNNENANPGFTHVQGPDGTTGYVPADKARQLIQSGQLKAIP